MTKNNRNWLEIEEGFVHFCNRYNFSVADRKAILAHFKPYFQEQRHKEAVEELEVVDNTNTDKNS